MAQDFVRPASSTWDEIANSSGSVEEMRERMKAKLAADGFIQRERGYEVGSDTLTDAAKNAAPAFVPSADAAPSTPRRETCIRVVFPGGNDQYEICGVSEEELDEKERRIRAMYARKP
jgi:hypothetical protein